MAAQFTLTKARSARAERRRVTDDLLEHRGLVDLLTKRQVLALHAFLCPLAILDVRQRRVPADGASLLVAPRIEAHQVPPIASVLRPHPSFHLGPFAADDLLEFASQPLEIVRMEHFSVVARRE